MQKIKFKSSMQATMFRITFISFVCIIAFFVINYFINDNANNNVIFSLGVTSLTIFYHVGIRLFLGEFLLLKFIPPNINYKRKWFVQNKFEQRVYKLLKVKKWKGNMPTYSPDEFSTEKNSWEQIISATCKSEIIHEVNVVISFIPLLFTFAFGSFVAFLITSIVGACLDLVFVIMQRYNRPRLIRMVGRNKTNK